MEYIYTIGRRKTSTATLRLYKKNGVNQINEKAVDQLYVHAEDQKVLEIPFKAADLDFKTYSFTAKVVGGGKYSQLEAVQHAIARAIAKMFPDKKKALKMADLITRDPRMVERKKPGLRKARRAEQYSKR
ncbi:MAG: 30S ribosomal protein S9 [Candidatus Dojkabacteria bacterium]